MPENANEGAIPGNLVLQILQDRAQNSDILALHLEAATLQAVTKVQADQIRSLTQTVGPDSMVGPGPVVVPEVVDAPEVLEPVPEPLGE